MFQKLKKKICNMQKTLFQANCFINPLKQLMIKKKERLKKLNAKKFFFN